MVLAPPSGNEPDLRGRGRRGRRRQDSLPAYSRPRLLSVSGRTRGAIAVSHVAARSPTVEEEVLHAYAVYHKDIISDQLGIIIIR